MKCEICGADIAGKGYRVYIDRAELIVCEKCAKKYGTPIEIIQSKTVPRKSRSTAPRRSRSYYPKELRYTVVEN
ncbi:MAG TPA: TIGR00270 family protein, partial [Thermoproteales archaeon]|nr:TIGR00270 family protein [Thermoproteales archaeon]